MAEPEREEQKPKVEQEQLEAWYPEYFVLTGGGRWIISRETACDIERALRRWPRPRWIRFVDISGATVRMKTAWIGYLQQSTPESRELNRRFQQERRKEEQDERDWNDDW